MLARMQRLNADKDYARLFAKGRSFHGRGVSMKAMKNGLDHTRIGFVVSTKVAKKANVRNLIKRRMREIVRKRFGDVLKGVDVAFMAKPESKTMDFAQIQESIVDIMWKSGLVTHK